MRNELNHLKHKNESEELFSALERIEIQLDLIESALSEVSPQHRAALYHALDTPPGEEEPVQQEADLQLAIRECNEQTANIRQALEQAN